MKKSIHCFVLLMVICCCAYGQQYSVLHTFQGYPADGDQPVASLVSDSAGNLYGTTKFGGTSGFGTVFELTPNGDGKWSESILYNFCPISNFCVDGNEPLAALAIDDSGNLYGTTSGGGTQDVCSNGLSGCGTVFELSPPSLPGGSWTESVIYSFCAGGFPCLDGYEPVSRLTLDAEGNLYGTTAYGGAGAGGYGRGSNGVVFELTPTSDGWIESVLYTFCPKTDGKFCPDGAQPMAGVTFDAFGNLYGTTSQGGGLHSAGEGTVYKLSPGAHGWTETVVATSHLIYKTGAAPLADVSIDKWNNLYSTLSFLGLGGNGNVFRLYPGGKATGFSFNGTDGATPTSGVTLDPKNDAIYGTTSQGGVYDYDGGVVYEISRSNQETLLYSFCPQTGCLDGSQPYGGVIEDGAGNLYGTTRYGGATNDGVVYEITPQ